VTGNSLLRRIAVAGGLLVATAAVAVVPLAGPASAEPNYPPVFNKISASSFVVTRGGSITFMARTFVPGSTVSFLVESGGTTVTSGTAVADADGKVTQDITFTEAGSNSVTFSGTSSKGKPLVMTVTVTVTDPSSGGGNGDNGGAGGTGGTGGTGGADNGTSAGGIPFIGGLPRTGAQIAATVAVGAALLGAGAFLVMATRRRRHA
jgi:LPXTG-motif cell wall-anchored protein